ncbi:hypothetical protein [Streptomyces sp. JJ36]|uniref:COG4315 family predicted lipoprotein n=1 Tax=Streptomyces sp. JJ36 TaxID=2736645 RepID=UPI001F16F6B3|nr:hypothetical protein [Streptomyces sp. JJ36]MCF6524211.1 hypothetical protein [Streptomyces sp. JJ36]
MGSRSAAAVATVTAALLAVLTGCGDGDEGGDGGASPSPTRTAETGTASPGETSPGPTGSPTEAATVQLRPVGELGRILTDEEGRTLYLFAKDTSAESTCYDACAEAWPPLTTDGQPQVTGEGVRKDLLGTTERRGGTQQVTYGGHPLYYFVSDDEPGDATGQGFNQFGAEWWVVNASGERVTEGDRQEGDGGTGGDTGGNGDTGGDTGGY